MKPFYKLLLTAMGVWAGGVLFASSGLAQLSTGSPAPLFQLKTLDGKGYDLAAMQGQPMVIIYFFAVESPSSQEGLLTIDRIAKQYPQDDLTVLGVTRATPEAVDAFIKERRPTFPILLDNQDVSERYQALQILPTVCILGPGLKLMDRFQGGGRSTEMMLLKLAERQLQRRQPLMARVISEEVTRKDPGNYQARTVAGYAAMREGDLTSAEKTFQDLSQEKGEAAVLGKEGLAGVYARKGQTQKALKLATEVEQSDPQRAYVHTVKGDMLYSQGKEEQAAQEYQKAVSKPAAEPFQKAEAHNRLGRIYTAKGQFQQARQQFDEAVDLDPYYIEATANKGITYEQEGALGKALEAYRSAQRMDKDDAYAGILAKKVEQLLLLQQDSTRNQQMDQQIQTLVERYKQGVSGVAEGQDSWTSPPMVISFLEITESGGLAPRGGFPTVIAAQAAEQLNESGRIQVVERVVIERLLQELNLGSSDLANPETALRLGRVLAARIIITGTLLHMPDKSLVSLRLVDTETSAIVKVISVQLSGEGALKQELHQLNREILSAIVLHYPLQGYVVKVADDEVLLNLGARQGVVTGARFDLIEEAKAISYKGRMLKTQPRRLATLEVTRVEPDLAYARITEQKRAIRPDDKLLENTEDVAYEVSQPAN